MLDLEEQKKRFRNHVATLTDYGNIKILDFKNPESCEYRIRFLFEEDYYRCHISGDLGELIAYNFKNMTYNGFSDFVHNTGYFKEKVDCCSRRIYEFNEALAAEELRERIKEYEWEEDIFWNYDSIDDFIDCVMDGYDNGISDIGYSVLERFDCDAWEWAYDIGKVSTGILELYLLAFELAKKQLDGGRE